MDKEKEIAILSELICNHGIDSNCYECRNRGTCLVSDNIADNIINADYRKADEVRKEIGNQLLFIIKEVQDLYGGFIPQIYTVAIAIKELCSISEVDE